jgi:hypothetical protein
MIKKKAFERKPVLRMGGIIKRMLGAMCFNSGSP